MKYRLMVCFFMLLGMEIFLASQAYSQQKGEATAPSATGQLVLSEAVMCEDIKAYAPVNRAIVFSISIGKVSCFTSFDAVPANMFIYHSWFRRDKLVTTKRFTLKPPRWATFSSIQLRQADRGPWRVEIHDQQGNIMKILRFSITD